MKAARVIGFVTLAFLSACTNKPAPSPSPTPSPTASTASPTPTTSRPPSAPSADRIVYTVSSRETPDRTRWDDIYLYEVASDRVTRLTSDGDRVSETVPRFRGQLVTFIVDRTDLVQLDPATGRRRRLLRVSRNLIYYSWSPDRTEVAYLESLTSGTHRLRVYNARTRATTTLRILGTPEGRGTGDLDAVTIDWNKTGDRILVCDSYLDPNRTVWLVRRTDGKDVIRPVRNATNAIWSADERFLFLMDLSPAKAGVDPLWQRLEIATEKRRRLALEPGSFHAIRSPDGSHLAATAHDPETNAHAIWVLDLRTGKDIRVAKGYRDAVWLDNETLALTRVVACTAGTSCEYYGYRATGTRRVTLTRTVTSLRLGSTIWDGLGKRNADVAYVIEA
jgi:hypothetical protein